MTPAETVWRMHGSLRGLADRALLPLRQRPLDVRDVTSAGANSLDAHLNVEAIFHEPDTADCVSQRVSSYQPLVQRADDLLANRWSFFQFDRKKLTAPFDWNYEYATGRVTPMTFAQSIDYRDFRVVGDAKVVWEPNRHQHLVVLARAYRATGDPRYAETVMDHLEDWARQCPFGRGINWRSPLELAIRIINWAWALALIESSGVVTSDRLRNLLPVVYRHLWDIQRKYSHFSSANNHLIGEAAGVFIGCTFFRSLRSSDAWRNEAGRILVQEIGRQTLEDGGNCELSSSYHLFVLEFFLLAEIVARRSQRSFGTAYRARLESMFAYLAALQEGGDHLPSLGDGDDGFVLDLEAPETRARSILSVGAELFDRDDWRALGEGHDERAYWLLGGEPTVGARRTIKGRSDSRLRSRALKASGYYLLQAGSASGDDRVSLTFDCGPLGFGAIAAHGHADALSFTLRVFGSDVIVDPGTYDYFTYPRWRDHFRSTRAHNTVGVDGLDQSQMLGSFIWGQRAVARCVRWQPTSSGGIVTGEHDGYSRLPDPVRHRRTIELDVDRATIHIQDELDGETAHDAEFCLHFAEHCVVSKAGPHSVRVDFGRGMLDIDLDSRLQVDLVHGQSNPPAGWVSRGYHHKAPATSLFATCAWSGKLNLRARMSLRKVGTVQGDKDTGGCEASQIRCNGPGVGKG